MVNIWFINTSSSMLNFNYPNHNLYHDSVKINYYLSSQLTVFFPKQALATIHVVTKISSNVSFLTCKKEL